MSSLPINAIFFHHTTEIIFSLCLLDEKYYEKTNNGNKMITAILNKTAFPSLVRNLDLCSINRKVIAHNIANVNTPDYQKKEVAFNDILQRTAGSLNIRATQPGHFSASPNQNARIISSKDKEIKSGVNNVDIDHEMVELAKNQMEFNFSATILARLFKTMKSCINERVS